MNVQPKLTPDDDCRPMARPATFPAHAPQRRIPQGPRAFLTWPVELEVDPWRP